MDRDQIQRDVRSRFEAASDAFAVAATSASDALRSMSSALARAYSDEHLAALEKFRDAVGAWLVTTSDDVCPMCNSAPDYHERDCWVRLTLEAWDELHGLVEMVDTTR